MGKCVAKSPTSPVQTVLLEFVRGLTFGNGKHDEREVVASFWSALGRLDVTLTVLRRTPISAGLRAPFRQALLHALSKLNASLQRDEISKTLTPSQVQIINRLWYRLQNAPDLLAHRVMTDLDPDGLGDPNHPLVVLSLCQDPAWGFED